MEKRRYPLHEADTLAADLVKLLGPDCERITSAGSVRRRKEHVHDLELLAVPRIRTLEQPDLFGQQRVAQESLLDMRVVAMVKAKLFRLREGKRGQTTYGPLNKLLVWVPTGMPVDLFTATLANWGMALLVRTGPAEWNIKVMATLQRLGLRGHAYGGISGPDGTEMDCPDEETIFRTLGWPYCPPELRS